MGYKSLCSRVRFLTFGGYKYLLSGVRFFTFDGYKSLRLGVTKMSYVRRVINPYVWPGLDFSRSGVINSFVNGLDLLRLGFINPYV